MKPSLLFVIAPVLGALLAVGLQQAVPRDGTVVRYVPPTLDAQRDSIVAAEARRAGVSVPLALAVSHVENFGGDSTALSRAGAIGLMQVMPMWRHSFEDECGCGPLQNRRRNACVGVRILRLYQDSTKTVNLALRRYHGSTRLHMLGDQYVESVLEKLVQITR